MSYYKRLAYGYRFLAFNLFIQIVGSIKIINSYTVCTAINGVEDTLLVIVDARAEPYGYAAQL